MKNIMILIGLVIISLSFAFSQEPNAIQPIPPDDGDPNVPRAYVLYVTCTDKPPTAYCGDFISVVASTTINGTTHSRGGRAWRREPGQYYGILDMDGMPTHDPAGNRINYTIMVTVPCGSQTVKPAPTGWVEVQLTATAIPC